MSPIKESTHRTGTLASLFGTKGRSGCTSPFIPALVLATLLALPPDPGLCAEGPPARDAFRVGFSSALFSEVNENDARAAVKAWAQTFAGEHNIPVDPDALILNGISALREALGNREVDLVSVLAEEYRALHAETPLSPLYVAHVNGRIEEEVLLLVHRESGIERLEDLQGRTLLVYRNPRASLALPWFNVLLRKKALPPAAGLVGSLTENPRLSAVVLPVFFKKVDACLVTRGSFETMVELNPQLGRTLVPLAESPYMLPVLLAFRADFAPPFLEDIFEGLRDLHQSVAGRQVLTIFKSEKLEEQPASILQSALDLLDRAEALRNAADGGESP